MGVSSCVVPSNGTFTSGLFTYQGVAYSAGIAISKAMSPESLYTRYGYDPYPGHDVDCVVYGYTDSSYSSGTGGTITTRERVFNVQPSSMSFLPIESNQWWYYLWDLSSHVGGWPCLETTTTSSTTGATPGVGQNPPTGGTTTSSLSKVYYGCNGVTKITTAGSGILCPVVSTTLSYTISDGKITDVSEKDPFPLIKSVSTNDLRVAITYSNGYGGNAATRFQTGQVINGWTISQVFTTDASINMHVLYLSGSGSDFTYNQSISSATAAGVVKAGKGIKDKCVLVGTYEFKDKTIYYTKATVAEGYPFGQITDPVLSVSVVNGVVSGVTVVSGGSGWDKINDRPPIGIDPPTTGDDFAKLEPNWVGDYLASVKVVYPGSGYTDASPPKAFVSYAYNKKTDIIVEKQNAKDVHAKEFDIYDKVPNNKSVYGISKEDWQKNTEPNFQEIKSDTFPPIWSVEEDPNILITRKGGRTGVRKDIAETMKPEYIKSSVVNDLSEAVPTVGKSFKDNVYIPSNKTSEEYYAQISDDSDKTYQMKSRKVYTFNGFWFELPCATATTKYNLIDYVPDSRETATITVTMAVDATNDNCSTCIGGTSTQITVSLTSGSNAINQTLTFNTGVTATVTAVSGNVLTVTPSGVINIFNTFTGTNPACAGTVQGVGTGGSPYIPGGTSYTTVQKSYSGTGCLDYSISGTIGVHHNVSNESAIWSSAVAAYGNPYTAICNP